MPTQMRACMPAQSRGACAGRRVWRSSSGGLYAPSRRTGTAPDRRRPFARAAKQGRDSGSRDLHCALCTGRAVPAVSRRVKAGTGRPFGLFRCGRLPAGNASCLRPLWVVQETSELKEAKRCRASERGEGGQREGLDSEREREAASRPRRLGKDHRMICSRRPGHSASAAASSEWSCQHHLTRPIASCKRARTPDCLVRRSMCAPLGLCFVRFALPAP